MDTEDDNLSVEHWADGWWMEMGVRGSDGSFSWRLLTWDVETSRIQRSGTS